MDTTTTHLLQGEVLASDDVEHHAARPLDGEVQQGTGDGRRGRLLRASAPRAPVREESVWEVIL